MTQPGWYQDPAGGPGLRWWDGGQWTAHQWAAPGAGQGPPSGSGLGTGPGPVEPGAPSSPERHAEFPRRQQEITVPPATAEQSPPRPAPMPNRRRFLWIAGIGAVGLAAVGGGVAVALTSGSKHPDGQTGSTATPGAPVPKGPAPTWSHALDGHVDDGVHSGGLGVLGDVLIRWDSSTAQAFDLATGAPRWTGSPDLPAGYWDLSWIGLNDSLLIGTAQNSDTNSSLVLALGSDGKQQFSHDVGRNAGGTRFSQVFDLDGTVALLGTTNEIVAIDVSSGSQLWRRALTAYDVASAVIGGQRCYLQDYTATFCLDMTSGNPLWATPNTASDSSSIASAAGALAIAGDQLGDHLVVLDEATGIRRPTAIQASTGINQVCVSDDLFIVGEDTNESASGEDTYRIWGINPRDGSKVWTTLITLPVVTGMTASADLVLVPTHAPVSMEPAGFLVLDGKTGAIAWAESGGGSADDWVACATQEAVYAASSTTVYAYPRHR